MADTLKQLKQRVTELETLRTQIDLDIQSYHRVIADQEGRSELPGRSITAAKAIVNEMFHILDTAGEPLHYRDIYKRLRDRGFEVAGQDPLKNTGAHLSADPRFVSDGRGLWRLASWPPPPEQLVVAHRTFSGGVTASVRVDDAVTTPTKGDDEQLNERGAHQTRIVEEVARKYDLSTMASEDLRKAVLSQDKYEVKRIARQLPDGSTLPFMADLAQVIEVLEGQRSA